jgi:ankyrin repeat protein
MTLNQGSHDLTCKKLKIKLFSVDDWVKRFDNRGKKYWQKIDTNLIQYVKPDTETYLIQAAILGNIAFIELYIKSKGYIGIVDPQKRTGNYFANLIILALHHAVSNGHKEIAAMLCTFGQKLNLIETEDLNGCTPLF